MWDGGDDNKDVDTCSIAVNVNASVRCLSFSRFKVQFAKAAWIFIFWFAVKCYFLALTFPLVLWIEVVKSIEILVVEVYLVLLFCCFVICVLSLPVRAGWAWSTMAKATAAGTKRRWEAWWPRWCRRPSIDTTGQCAAGRSWSDTSSEFINLHSTPHGCWQSRLQSSKKISKYKNLS